MVGKFVAALVLPLGIALILVPFRSSFANTASALVLVGVIVAVAVTGNRFTGLVAAVSATLWQRVGRCPPPWMDGNDELGLLLQDGGGEPFNPSRR
jgi:hypothetical protein